MKLRYRADRRTLVWAFGLIPTFAFVQYRWPSLAGWLLPLAMYGAYSAAVIAHNHNHSPTFTGRRTNRIFSAWISFFYGFPTYGWIPTHNENHHRWVGAEGDATVVVGAQDSAWLAFTHFFRSTVTQGPLLVRYRERLYRRSRSAWIGVWLQYVVVYGGHALMCALAIALHGVGRGLLVYASALGIPAFMALWGVMFTNWVQHVSCNPNSRWNHSRNFVSGWMNALVFDNGFHTMHHDRPGLHWSRLRAEHAKIAHLVSPECTSPSIFHFVVERYVLGDVASLRRPARGG